LPLLFARGRIAMLLSMTGESHPFASAKQGYFTHLTFIHPCGTPFEGEPVASNITYIVETISRIAAERIALQT
jgi:hypothetical protein